MNLREFENWALAQGSVGNPTEEGSYKGECVSLVQQYLSKVHNIPFKARGNAKDWANITIEGFNRYAPDNTLKPGDIVVYDWGQYGHIAIITVDGKSLEQNKNRDRIITVSDVTPGYVMIHRPANINLGIDTAQSYNIGQTYTTQVDLKVREGAGTDYRQKNKNELTPNGQENAYNYRSAVLKTGTRVTCQEVALVGDDVWIRIPSGWIAAVYNNKVYIK